MRINRTTQRTIAMLDLISKHPKGLSLAEITNIMGIPKTSVYDILRTLDEMKMVELVDQRTKVYALGVMTFVMGSRYIDELDLVKVARPYIEELGDNMSKTVFLGIRNGAKIIYVDKYQPKTEILTTCSVGSENGVHCTSLGKAILAFDNDYKGEIDKLDLMKKTEKTITDKEKLYIEMERIKIQGYAIDDREHQEHMLCSGAPIFDHTGKAIAAISATGLYVEGKDYSHEFHMIRDSAMKISRKLGYRGI